jgi:hypothetical protein
MLTSLPVSVLPGTKEKALALSARALGDAKTELARLEQGHASGDSTSSEDSLHFDADSDTEEHDSHQGNNQVRTTEDSSSEGPDNPSSVAN